MSAKLFILIHCGLFVFRWWQIRNGEWYVIKYQLLCMLYLFVFRMPQFATRATLLSTECLKGRSLYGEAAKQFIRMTSEDSDLRSALLLEQASYCFLKATRPHMMRKYAFHIVLAGHRFSKAGQRKHSLRCYKQAHQVNRLCFHSSLPPSFSYIYSSI
jgi:hypothetical protein